MPDGVGIIGSGPNLRILFDSGDVEVINIETTLELDPTSREQISAVAKAAMSQTQDAITVRLRLPWPGLGTAMPDPTVESDGDYLKLGFSSSGGERIECQPILWNELVA